MALQDEEPHHLRRPSHERILQRQEVAERLAHLSTVNRHHIVVEPVAHERAPGSRFALRDFALMVGELVLQTPAVDIDAFAKVLHRHGRALDVPARKTLSPGAGPAHDMPLFRSLPEGEVARMALVRVDIDTGPRLQLLGPATRQLAIPSEPLHVEVDRAVRLVGKAQVDQLPDHLDLLDDVSGSPGRDIGPDDVQGIHVFEIAARILLRDLHGMHLPGPGEVLDLVFSLVGVIAEVSHVGDVLDVQHLVAEESKIAHDDIE